MADDENDVKVTWEDQQRINEFGKLTARKGELEAELELIVRETSNLDEALNELLELQLEGDFDDDLDSGNDDDNDNDGKKNDKDSGLLSFKLGEIFVRVDNDEAEQRIEQQKAKLAAKIDSLNSEIAQCKSTLAELRLKLYASLGQENINLD
jgi:prefoldin subunit 4